MNIEVVALNTPVSEAELGKFARFTHTPIGEPLTDKSSDDARYVQIALSCLKMKHMSVFEFAHILLRVTCPIYVARQLMRHRNGTFLEKSLRHLEPTCSDFLGLDSDNPSDEAYLDAIRKYHELREHGAKKEDARAVLTLGTPTSFLWYISLRSLFNVFEQRLHPAAQEATRGVVKEIFLIAREKFPETMNLWLSEHPIHAKILEQ